MLLRRTNDELREIVWATQKLYPQAYPGAKWSAKASQWTFPSGARLWLTYLERPEDVLRYQGQAFCWIGWDELTQHPTSFAFDYMRSRLRTTDPTLPLCVSATSNPGGPGHGWTKRTLIDPAPPNTSFAAKISILARKWSFLKVIQTLDSRCSCGNSYPQSFPTTPT